MGYKLLVRSGLRVSEVALGIMTFGEDWGGASKEECRCIFDANTAAGGNFIDTANHYTGGTSERFVGLETVSAVAPGFPHDFLTRARPIIYGNSFDKIDNHRDRRA